ncbi:MAG: bifunctional phosphopantothenoylcysteine decarboxylase/phosphopantothenate--cysteine ligase CoaBC [Brevinematales bacterium]|nr:bifunctional phosphopantothenoylcysteine decarboxylase/phosphopantothenate--cysteine ligase CoaBC [Brevinematales bacterium]
MARFLFGISSSVSIYKVPNVIRLMLKRGHEVKVIMTENATKLISPILFEAISQNKVYVDNFNYDDPLIHITNAKWADTLVIIPATANVIGKIANGICDNLLTTTTLAFPSSKRRILVPAMNKEMWANPLTQDNLKKLQNYGWEILEPEEGTFASPLEGIGKGRLPNEKTILYHLLRNPNGKLKGKKVLVTAGATKEYLDNVRYISNDSSGLMGLSLALASYLEGADVSLIYGEMKYKPITFIKSTKVISTEDMLQAVKKEFERVDILFMASAVADFKPINKTIGKLPKENISEIKLEKTPDILKTISQNKGNKIVVGFALNSYGNIEEYIKNKLSLKGVDYIVANQIEIEDGKIIFNPMGSKTNKITLISKSGQKYHFEGNKIKVAKFIIEKIYQSFNI